MVLQLLGLGRRIAIAAAVVVCAAAVSLSFEGKAMSHTSAVARGYMQLVLGVMLWRW